MFCIHVASGYLPGHLSYLLWHHWPSWGLWRSEVGEMWWNRCNEWRSRWLVSLVINITTGAFLLFQDMHILLQMAFSVMLLQLCVSDVGKGKDHIHVYISISSFHAIFCHAAATLCVRRWQRQGPHPCLYFYKQLSCHFLSCCCNSVCPTLAKARTTSMFIFL